LSQLEFCGKKATKKVILGYYQGIIGDYQ